MKRILSIVLALVMLLTGMVTALAADTSRSYEFDLTSNGSHELRAAQGDILTVTLTLRRTDAAEAADLYGFQNEIRYDDEFFEIVPGGGLLASGVETNDIALMGGDRAFYVNFLSLGGGESWQSEQVVATFQVKVLSDHGSSALKSENFLVSVQDGSDTYTVSAQDLTVVVSDECTVRFDPRNEGEVTEVTVAQGGKLTQPADPTREGYTFTGWYRDVNATDEWNFRQDTVTGNMTLYAGWTTGAFAPGSQHSAFPWWWILLAVIVVVVIVALLQRKKDRKA